MSAFSELLDVVEHLVSTHHVWNMSLSQEEALAKVAKARLEELPTLVKDVETLVSDVETLKADVTAGQPVTGTVVQGGAASV